MNSRAKSRQVRIVGCRTRPCLSEAGTAVLSQSLLLSLLALLLMSCTRSSDQASVRTEPMTTEVRRVGLADLKFRTDVVGKLKFKGGVNLVSPSAGCRVCRSAKMGGTSLLYRTEGTASMAS
jgi:hypothetical protein